MVYIWGDNMIKQNSHASKAESKMKNTITEKSFQQIHSSGILAWKLFLSELFSIQSLADIYCLQLSLTGLYRSMNKIPVLWGE